LVELAIDRAPQLLRDKNHFGAVVVDPMREIAANKVGALLDRFEARDLVDLKLLLGAGLTLPEVLQDAQQKQCRRRSCDARVGAGNLADSSDRCVARRHDGRGDRGLPRRPGASARAPRAAEGVERLQAILAPPKRRSQRPSG
jgi:hypothetical protein